MSQVDWDIGGSVGGGSYRRRNVLLELCLRRCGTDCSTWVATTIWLKGYILGDGRAKPL